MEKMYIDQGLNLYSDSDVGPTVSLTDSTIVYEDSNTVTFEIYESEFSASEVSTLAVKEMPIETAIQWFDSLEESLRFFRTKLIQREAEKREFHKSKSNFTSKEET